VIDTECLHIQNLKHMLSKKTRKDKGKTFGCFSWWII